MPFNTLSFRWAYYKTTVRWFWLWKSIKRRPDTWGRKGPQFYPSPWQGSRDRWWEPAAAWESICCVTVGRALRWLMAQPLRGLWTGRRTLHQHWNKGLVMALDTLGLEINLGHLTYKRKGGWRKRTHHISFWFLSSQFVWKKTMCPGFN